MFFVHVVFLLRSAQQIVCHQHLRHPRECPGMASKSHLIALKFHHFLTHTHLRTRLFVLKPTCSSRPAQSSNLVLLRTNRFTLLHRHSPSISGTSDLSRDTVSCEITYMASVNPGGWAPAAIVKYAFAHILSSLCSLLQMHAFLLQCGVEERDAQVPAGHLRACKAILHQQTASHLTCFDVIFFSFFFS
jgi:hypothetical protein